MSSALKNQNSTWDKLEPIFKSHNLTPTSLKTYRNTLIRYLDYTNCELKDIEDLKVAYKFIDVLKERGCKEGYIKANIRRMSSIVNSLRDESEVQEVPFFTKNTKNIFKHILKTRRWIKDVESHPARSIDEIEVFIGNIAQPQWKLAYVIGSIGFRRHEVFKMKAEQVDLDQRAFINVKRKGQSIHRFVGIPKWLLPYLEDRVTELKPKDKLIGFNSDSVDWFSKRYYSKLMDMRTRIHENDRLKEKYKDLIGTLNQLQMDGPVLFHSLRSSWDTLSEEYGMREKFRKYHLNHAMGGMDDVYIQINPRNSIWETYLNELDTKSPQYEFGMV